MGAESDPEESDKIARSISIFIFSLSHHLKVCNAFTILTYLVYTIPFPCAESLHVNTSAFSPPFTLLPMELS